MRAAAAYRILVAAQTIAWAAVAFYKVASGAPRAVMSIDRVGLTLTILAIGSIAVAALTFRRRLVVAWFSLHAAGVLAWIGYAATGETICFAAGILALVAMHVASPNRMTS